MTDRYGDAYGLGFLKLVTFIMLSDLKINFYIGDDGFIYEGRGINFIAAHW